MNIEETKAAIAARTHELKTWPIAFDAILSGAKTHEYRKNDRDYQVGDNLWLREWSPDSGYSWRDITVPITYVGKDGFGIPDGYTVLSIRNPDHSRLEAENQRLRAALGLLVESPEYFCGASNGDHAQAFCECNKLREHASAALAERETK